MRFWLGQHATRGTCFLNKIQAHDFGFGFGADMYKSIHQCPRLELLPFGNPLGRAQMTFVLYAQGQRAARSFHNESVSFHPLNDPVDVIYSFCQWARCGSRRRFMRCWRGDGCLRFGLLARSRGRTIILLRRRRSSIDLFGRHVSGKRLLRFRTELIPVLERIQERGSAFILNQGRGLIL